MLLDVADELDVLAAGRLLEQGLLVDGETRRLLIPRLVLYRVLPDADLIRWLLGQLLRARLTLRQNTTAVLCSRLAADLGDVEHVLMLLLLMLSTLTVHMRVPSILLHLQRLRVLQVIDLLD